MANLTSDKQVVKEKPSLGGESGYWLVIYEARDGGGTSVVEVLQPGIPFEAPQILFSWRKKASHFAIAVVDAKQSLQFSELSR